MEIKKFNPNLSASLPCFYVACDGFIINLSEPFLNLEECKEFIAKAKERDRLELMLHKRLLKKILRKKVSPDLHDYAVLTEVVL